MIERPHGKQRPRIGLITIGQSPRDDIVPTFSHLLGEDADLVESGALDNLSEDQIVALAPQADEEFFVSRLRNGGSVRLSTVRLLSPLQRCIDALVGEQINLLVLLCAGSFPDLTAEVPIIFPDRALWHFVRGFHPTGTLGVIAPHVEQFPLIRRKWPGYALELRAHSPYEYSRPRMQAAAASLGSCRWIILDGMAYTAEMSRIVREETGTFVIVPQVMIAHTFALLFEE